MTLIYPNRMKDAQSRPRKEYIPKPKPVIDFGETNEQSNGGFTPASAPPTRSAGMTKPLTCLTHSNTHTSFLHPTVSHCYFKVRNCAAPESVNISVTLRKPL